MKKSMSAACVMLAAILWGCISVFYKQLSAIGFTQAQVVFLRVTTAAVMMALYIAIKQPSWFRIRLRDIWMFIGTGVVSLAFFNFCYFNAMDETSVPVAATLLYTAPMFVMLLSAVLFHEKLTPLKCFCVVITFAGCVLVTGVMQGHGLTLRGLLYGLGAGIGYALYTIFSVYALRRYATETVTFYTFVFACVSILPLCGVNVLVQTAVNAVLPTVFFSLGIGFLACFLPYWLYTKGLEGVSPSQASVMATLEPVVACVVGVVFLQEDFTLSAMCGVALILLSIVLLNIQKEKP